MKNIKALALMALAVLVGLGAALFAASWVSQTASAFWAGAATSIAFMPISMS